MRDYFSRLLRSQLGFSMVQALVGLGVVGGLSLVVAQLGKQTGQNQKAASANYAIAETTAEIQGILSNRQNCADTFRGIQVAPNGRATVPLIMKNGNPSGLTPLANETKGSAPREVSVTSMTLTRRDGNSLLTVNFRKNNVTSGMGLTSASSSRDFIINTVWDTNNRVVDCESDVSNFINTVTELAILRACPPINPADSSENARRFLPNDDNAPTACRALNQLVDPSNDLTCPVGSNYSGFLWQDGRYQKICQQAVNINRCEPDELLYHITEGNFRCVKVSCPPGQLATGRLDGDGRMICHSCPSGTLLVSTGAGLSCANLTCPNGRILRGVQANGQPDCAPALDTSSCAEGGRLVLDSAGQLKLDCCRAVCNDSALHCSGAAYPSSNGCGTCTGTAGPNCSASVQANHCIGSPFLSPNGCGQCTGTKVADCSDAANFCQGTSYQSSNGCGQCTGTKSPVAETSNWVETTTYRQKPGSSCTNGTFPRERLRQKVCNQDAVCGGAACTPEEQWVDDGTQSCTPPCSEGSIRAGSQISHTRNFRYCGGSSYSGDVWVHKCEKCVSGKWVEQAGQQHYYRTQNICSGSQPVPPSNTSMICRSADPCDSGTQVSGYNEVTSGIGTFDFCSFSMRGGGCFIAGTKITMFSGEKKNIEDIQVGDELLDGQKQKVTVKKLLRVFHRGDIISINGGGYFFTPNHPFLTTSGWRSLDPEMSNKESPGLDVKLLKVGDILVKQNGVEVIMTIDRVPTREQVYNFELDGSHEYIADDYVVHNKMPIENP